MIKIEKTYHLDDCLDWILENGFKRVAIQLKLEDLKHSFAITKYLREKSSDRLGRSSSPATDIVPLDIYVNQASTCCVDLLVTQHVSKLDAIIHFGKVCLSKPEICNQHISLPILFAFNNQLEDEDKIKRNVASIINEIESLRQSGPSLRICFLFDTNLINYASKVDDIVRSKPYSNLVDVAKLHCQQSTWQTTPANQDRFITNLEPDSNLFGYYVLKKPIDEYVCAIYLGDQLSIQLSLQGPSKLVKINCSDNITVEHVNITRLLNKRMALVGQIKDEMELSIGVIITNPLPDITSLMERLVSYSKARKHTLYYISMVQTIDECKIGNFDICDAFIIANSCTCSSILESLVFNRPIITELEYKIACGIEAEYGKVFWPGSSTLSFEEDLINRRRVSDVSLSLIHLRNELLERCSQARSNKWSGLDYNPSTSGDEGAQESLTIRDGLKGIASSYTSEPLQKICHVEGMADDGTGKTVEHET